MFFFIPICIYILLMTVLAIIRWRRPAFQYFWFIAVIGSILTWPVAYFSRLTVPQIYGLHLENATNLLSSYPSLIIDPVSWPITLSLVTLLAAGLMLASDPSQSRDGISIEFPESISKPNVKERPHFSELIQAIAITSGAWITVISGDLITFVIILTALDLTELFFASIRFKSFQQIQLAAIQLSIRIAAVFLLVWGGSITQASNKALSLFALPEELLPFILIFALIRLLSTSIHGFSTYSADFFRFSELIRAFAPNASVVMLLVRMSMNLTGPKSSGLALWLFSLVAIVFGLLWLIKSKAPSRHFIWIFTITGFILLSTVHAVPEAVLAWGMTLILGGGLIFLYQEPGRSLNLVYFLGVISLITFPFTPAWPTTKVFDIPFDPSLITIFLAQCLFEAGLFFTMISSVTHTYRKERWITGLGFLGLMLLPITLFLITWWSFQQGIYHSSPPNRVQSLLGIITILIAFPIFIVRRLFKFSRGPVTKNRYRKLSAGITGLGDSMFHFVQNSLSLVNNMLEGPGGILWALVLLTLLATVFLQISF